MGKEKFAKRYNKIYYDNRLSLFEKDLLIDYINEYKVNGNTLFEAADTYYVNIFCKTYKTIAKYRKELEKKGLLISVVKSGCPIRISIQEENIINYFGFKEDIFKE